MYLCADRETYIRNLGGNPLARRVKMNDLTHNMDIHRLPAPTKRIINAWRDTNASMNIFLRLNKGFRW